MTSRLLWKIASSAAVMAAGHTARHITRAGWRAVKRVDPPLNPASRKTSWQEALLWTVFSSLVVGLFRLLTRRGAASFWKEETGHYPSQR